MRRLALPIAVACALATPVGAQAPDEGHATGDEEKVLLLAVAARTDFTDKALLAEAQESFKEGALALFKERLVVESRARSARCVTSSRCVGNLTRRADAGRGVAVLLGATGDDVEVSFLVADAAGEEVLAGTRTYEATALVEGLRHLVTELLMPASVSGQLAVPGIDDEAYVLLDGVPASAARLREGIGATLGPHTLTVLRAGRDPEVHELDIRFGEVTEVTLAPAPPPVRPEVRVVMPWWPAAVAGGIAAAALGTGAAFSLDMAYAVGTQQNALNALEQQAGDDLFPAKVARQPQVAALRSAAGTDAMMIAASVAIAGVATAAAGALLAAWLVGGGARPALTEEAP